MVLDGHGAVLVDDGGLILFENSRISRVHRITSHENIGLWFFKVFETSLLKVVKAPSLIFKVSLEESGDFLGQRLVQ